ncbi:mechanosensitive ion channel family protein [Halomonas sp. ANAO-440]|uniref:mechanosensitive ion channel family protein n=1 Tax=Halomonas sp. ANAO-440 TaxID=2861360 RepID=UPI001CAA53A2|nr:mechanosensitive ion channel domain-containing protein [Halomonas sp. ANAO-440]MBZ0329703.1 mechanosensitive ion channel family protein [Halomonas sp. ANAO-440]
MTGNGAWRLWSILAVMAAAIVISGASLAQMPQGAVANGGESESDSEEREWFPLDTLNDGLDATPDAVRRDTPRESIRSFQQLTDQEEYISAAHVLNLSELDAAEQSQRGAELARQLAEILRRGEWLDVSDLPGRQDAAIEDPSGQHPQAGEPRRNLELASLEAKGDTYDIRLARYRVDEEDPIWLITPDSVASIPMLYEEYGPSLLEAYIPERFKTSFGRLQIWEWIAIPVFLMLIGLVGWGVYGLVGLLSQWFPNGVPSIFASRIRGPMAFLIMAFVAQSLLDYVVSFTAVATTFIRILLIIMIAWGVGTIALRLVDTILLKVTRRMVGEIDDTKPKDERKLLTTLYAVRRIIILITVAAVSVYVLSQIPLFETLGMSLLASASVLAVLVGIAGQAVLGNILSSFQLSLAKPIRIGDLVMFEGQWCYVEGIFYTFIRLRSWDERRLIVPVTYFVSKPFENLSVKSAKMYRTLELVVHLSADTQVIREKFLEYAKEEDNVVEHHRLCCYVTGQSERAQTISCYLMASDPFAGWVAEMNIRERLMAFIRDNHPEWWPREVVVLSQHDITKGDEPQVRPPSGVESRGGEASE